MGPTAIPLPQTDDDVVDRLALSVEHAMVVLDVFSQQFGAPNPDLQQRACALSLSRAVSDIRGGSILLEQGFLAQVASVIRPIIECFCIAKIAYDDCEFAKEWLTPGSHFAVGKLRKRAGIDNDHGFALAYKRLCELSHPRAEGAGYQLVLDEKGVPTCQTGAIPRDSPLTGEIAAQFASMVFEFVAIIIHYFPFVADAPRANLAVLMHRCLRNSLHEILDAVPAGNPDQARAIEDQKSRIDSICRWPENGWTFEDLLWDFPAKTTGPTT